MIGCKSVYNCASVYTFEVKKLIVPQIYTWYMIKIMFKLFVTDSYCLLMNKDVLYYYISDYLTIQVSQQKKKKACDD